LREHDQGTRTKEGTRGRIANGRVAILTKAKRMPL
jgi:hypothetical protein